MGKQGASGGSVTPSRPRKGHRCDMLVTIAGRRGPRQLRDLDRVDAFMQSGGFKRSSQRQMSERRLRWGGGGGGGGRPGGRSCGRLGGRPAGGLFIRGGVLGGD